MNSPTDENGIPLVLTHSHFLGPLCFVLTRQTNICLLRFQVQPRKNVFAYAESHGLGQSGGGWTDIYNPGSLMYELGSLLCVDASPELVPLFVFCFLPFLGSPGFPRTSHTQDVFDFFRWGPDSKDEGAKLPNHFVVDIEKIVRDCMLLCPDDDALPGEVLHDAGQNPIVASSIGNTQHTQISKASVEEFPLMMQQQSPRWCGRLAAFLDIVQVGTSEDAFFVSAHTQQPDSKPLLEFFIQLRLDYMKAFGRSVDFNCTCHASTRGGFYVTLAPVACMRKIKVAAGQGCLGSDMDYLNPDSGDTVTKLGLPVATVDCSQGKGNVLCVTRELWERCLEGRALLSRLYDFNRKPGALAIAQRMLEKMLE